LKSENYKRTTIYGNPDGLDWLRKRIELDEKVEKLETDNKKLRDELRV
jgi:hypothetical protein